MLSCVDVAQWSKWNLRNNSKFHFQNTKYHITLSKRTVDEVSFEYSHHKISSLQSKFTTDSLIFPKRGRFHHWREMRQTIHSRLFHVLSNWFKRLASSELGLVKFRCLCLSNGILRLYCVCSLPYFFFFLMWSGKVNSHEDPSKSNNCSSKHQRPSKILPWKSRINKQINTDYIVSSGARFGKLLSQTTPTTSQSIFPGWNKLSEKKNHCIPWQHVIVTNRK